MATTMNASKIAELRARRTRKGEGYADSLAACLDGARQGLLFDVDTQNAGEDSLIVAASEANAVAIVAEGYDGESHADWTAERITLDE
jgi:hypothetical protein